MSILCTHCDTVEVPAHADEGYGHEFLCCDCHDLSFGMSMEMLNAARALNGRVPIEHPWPGRREDGRLNLVGKIRYRWWPRLASWWTR